jgi:FMN reductase
VLIDALAMAEAQGATTELLDVRELDLPMHVPYVPVEGYAEPGRAQLARLLDASRRADAMLWSSPTYHGTVSAPVKNALDHLEILAGDDRAYLAGRAVGLIAVAQPATWVAMMQAVGALRAWLAPTRVALGRDDFTPELQVKEGPRRRRLERLMDELLWFARLREQRS